MSKFIKPKKWVLWSRQQRRAYHRSMSCLTYWNEAGYQVRWGMLSTAHVSGEAPTPEALASLSEDFEKLRQMIERRFGYKGVEFLKVLTAEGGGVIHCYLAWRGPRLFFIPQRWLSAAWKRIHNSSYVWIAEVKTGKSHRRNLSAYIVSQYVASQDDFIRCDYSYRRTFGFPLVRVWEEFKKYFPGREVFSAWHKLLAGGEVVSAGGLPWSLESVRANYENFRKIEKGEWGKDKPKAAGLVWLQLRLQGV